MGTTVLRTSTRGARDKSLMWPSVRSAKRSKSSFENRGLDAVLERREEHETSRENVRRMLNMLRDPDPTIDQILKQPTENQLSEGRRIRLSGQTVKPESSVAPVESTDQQARRLARIMGPERSIEAFA